MRALMQSASVWPASLPTKVAPSTRPGIRRGPAPMKTIAQRSHNVFDRIALRLMARTQAWYAAISVEHQSNRLDKKIDQLNAMDASALCETHDKLCADIRVSGHSEGSLINSLAQAVIAARHSMGLDPHKGQRTAALALLQGRFVEMPTGEGKTLAVALAAAVSALDGTPVHVITANDYLADRDITLLEPFYSALGLTAACVLPTMDDDARRSAYNCDIAYVTGKQVAFDWLRDSLGDGNCKSSLVKRLGALTRPGVQSQSAAPLLRGLCLAIVDEADSLLIDDARTPVVLAVERASTSNTDAELVVALGFGAAAEKRY